MDFFNNFITKYDKLATFGAFIGTIIMGGVFTWYKNRKNISEQIENDDIVKEQEKKIQEDKICLILLKENNIMAKIYHILDREILEEQMRVVEANVKRVHYGAVDLVAAIIEPIVGDIRSTNYYTNFENVADLILNRVLDIFRRYCKENHFLDKSEGEFQIYIGECDDEINKMIQATIKTRYPQQNSIKDFNKIKAICPEISNCIRKCLMSCREISRKKQEEIEKLRTDFETEVLEHLSIKFELKI